MANNITKYSDAEIDTVIKRSINECLKMNPDFHKSDTLVIVTYSIMKAIFIKEKKHIILDAPTGTGKSVIGYLSHFCYTYINYVLTEELIDDMPTAENFNLYSAETKSYLLTSSKILQEQIDGDFTRFNIEDYFSMLKGIVNYECTFSTEQTGQYHSYAERYCMGMDSKDKQMLPCYQTCPYINKRFKTSGSSCAVLNYPFFLNILKSETNPFFKKRDLTICDEAHLIPEVVQNQFNIELTQMNLIRVMKMMNGIEINFPKVFGDELYNLQDKLGLCFKFFTIEKIDLSLIKVYVDAYRSLVNELTEAIDKHSKNESVGKVISEMFGKDAKRLLVGLEYMNYDEFVEDLQKRPEDTYIKSEFVGVTQHKTLGENLPEGNYKLYKHVIKDLSETEMCRKYFLTKVDVAIYMSATLGNMNDFGKLIGLEPHEFEGFRLTSNFNFDKSPIFICKSGYLNWINFQGNIDKCINDTLRVCEHLHPKDKGIIHTSTFQIAEMIQQRVETKQCGVTNPKRYLFYRTSQEKEACIDLMKSNSIIPYIIIGPSLYEGIDLKDDYGRFNVLVKAPYSGMDDYTKEKMVRYPFWYERVVLEKIEQSIGRTNRHIDDWSKTYLIDSSLEKLVSKLPEHITKRLKYQKIY